MSENAILSLKILLTGFVVVFAVLFLLIGIIKLYGTIVYNIQTGAKKSKKEKQAKNKAVSKPEPVAVQHFEQPQTEGVPEEIVAVIAAAVDAMYGTQQGVRIKSIKKSPAQRSNWAMAGVIDNTRPF